MSPVANGIGLVMMVIFTGLCDPRHAWALETGSVKIEVAYTEHGNLYYYSLNTKSVQSQFSLHYYEYLKRPQADEARVQFLAFNLSGSLGRELMAAFLGLEVSWNPREYEWRSLPEHFRALPEDREPCGMVVFGDQQLLACPLSPWASAKQSCQANNVAWLIQLFETTRYRLYDRKIPVSRKEAGDSLLGLLRRIPRGHEVEVYERGVAVGHRIPIGWMLRSVVAEALIHGGLLDAPMARPEPEIRRAAVEWNSERLPQEDARRVLLQALSDTDSSVRASAAMALATEVGPDDRTTIEAIREVLAREPDPVVKQVIQELLEGATTQRGRNGSP